MLAKLVVIAALIALACAGCGDVESKCGKFQKKMKELAESGSGSKDEMCCILNEQVTCVTSQDCAQVDQILAPAKAQIQALCGSYSYTEGCSGSWSIVPSLTLMSVLTIILRFYY